jgi:hypothetical protein
MAISRIHAGSGAIIVVPASQLNGDTVVEADAFDSVVIVYMDGDTSVAESVQLALTQRQESRDARRCIHGTS